MCCANLLRGSIHKPWPDRPKSTCNLERFVTDQESAGAPELLPPCRPSTGKKVAIVGAGPSGLSAAYSLARQGHAVTLLDRHEKAGGSLRSVPEQVLPPAILDRELEVLASMDIELKPGIELGKQVRIDSLSREFHAILLTVGQPTAEEGEKLGVAFSSGAVKADPNTCQTALPGVFAAGAAVRPVNQLVRALAEGRAAAECIHRFFEGRPPRRPEKTFSSVMGRLDPGELKQFLATSNSIRGVSPCDRCAGLTHGEAALESTRCLHCDCRSSGNCVLQLYAQV